MIWVKGEIVPDDALKISVLDRTFEHGLGLFETFRTWNGHATLLARHLARLRDSAARLGLPLDDGALPDDEAVARLRQSEAIEGDSVLRVTLSGGTSEEGVSVVWMRSRPLPGPHPKEGVALIPCWGVTDPADPFTRHKSLNYWSRRLAQESGSGEESHEAILVDRDGHVWEGARTNLFVVRRDVLLTPGLAGPLVPGIMRQVILERAEHLGLSHREENLTLDSLRTASEVFLTNSVRGIIPAASLEGRKFADLRPWTMQLRSELSRWLNSADAGPAA
jgi:branched-chain amino acid aminotransferase